MVLVIKERFDQERYKYMRMEKKEKQKTSQEQQCNEWGVVF